MKRFLFAIIAILTFLAYWIDRIIVGFIPFMPVLLFGTWSVKKDEKKWTAIRLFVVGLIWLVFF